MVVKGTRAESHDCTYKAMSSIQNSRPRYESAGRVGVEVMTTGLQRGSPTFASSRVVDESGLLRDGPIQRLTLGNARNAPALERVTM